MKNGSPAVIRAVPVMLALALLVLLVSCGDAQTPVDVFETIGDTGGDTTTVSDTESDAGDTSSDSGDALAVSVFVQFDGPRTAPPGATVPIVVSVDGGTYTGDLAITVDGAATTIFVARGRGSLPVPVPAVQGTVGVRVAQEGYHGAFDLVVQERPIRTVSGSLAGGDLEWTSDTDILVASDITIPSGSTLAIGQGTRVLIGDKVRFTVDGSLVVTGVHDDPVWFLPAIDVPSTSGWGEVDVGGGAEIDYAWFSGGGADTGRAFGHSGSQPVIRVSAGARVDMTGGGIVDCPGKAFASQSGTVLLDGLLISRVDQGGEHKASLVEVRRSHFMQIPDGDGQIDDDDNDGIYLSDTEGTGPACLVQDCVFFAGEDDAIDHNGAEVVIDRTWIQRFAHEGVAASKGRDVTIIDSVVMDCDQGIEAGYEGPKVHVQNCLLTGNNVGLRWGDSYEWPATGTIDVRSTVSVKNVTDNVLFMDDQQGAPPAGSATVLCSMVDDDDWNGVDGNLPGVPSWNDSGCIRNGVNARPDGCGPLGPQLCMEPPEIAHISISIDPGDWKWLHANPESEKEFNVSIELGGRRYHDTLMQVHGGFARTVPKLSFRFEIPDDSADMLDLFGDGPEKQRRFVLKAGWIDGTWIREYLTMDLIRRAGGLAPRISFVELKVNGEWQGLYLLVERIDKLYLKRQRLETDDICLLKAENHAANWKDKANPLDGYDLQYGDDRCAPLMGELLGACTGAATTDAGFESDVVPLMNLDDYRIFEFVRSFANDRDAFTKNYYLYLNADGDGEDDRLPARLVNWDADAVFGNNWDGKVIDAENGSWYGWDSFAPRFLAVPAWRSKYLDEFRYYMNTGFRPVVLKGRAERVARHVRGQAIKDLELWDRGMDFEAEVLRLKQAIQARHSSMTSVLSRLD